MKRFRLLLALVCVVAGVTAAERHTLSGSYRIGGATIYDPPTGEMANTHLYIELTGSAARDLYDTMAVAPKADECTGPESRVKSVGQMQCTRYEGGKRYRCWFGIDVRNQKLTRGVVC